MSKLFFIGAGKMATAIAGGLVMSLLLARGVPEKINLLTGFATVVLLRCLASHYRWNLPKIT